MREFVTLLLTLSVFFGALSLLSPEGSTGKTVRCVFALLFTLSVITFLSKTPLFSSLPQVFTPADTGDCAARIIEAEAVSEMSRVLSNNGLSFRKIAVSASISENGLIIINEVTVYSDEDPAKIKGLFDCEVKKTG